MDKPYLQAISDTGNQKAADLDAKLLGNEV